MRMPAGFLHDDPLDREKQMRLLSVPCIEVGHGPHLGGNNSESLNSPLKDTIQQDNRPFVLLVGSPN